MTKDKVLALLKKEQGFLSGEKISAEIGVTRMAVSSAVKALRAEGYRISSVTNRGYCLEQGADRLSSGELLAHLGEERMKRVICLDTIGSTNQYLKELANKGAAAGTVVIAEEQTSGRGRRGRSFSSPKHKGIYLSYLLRPDSAPADSTSLTAWSAVAVQHAIFSVCGVKSGIKWVNDLILGSKKICGILTELSIESESAHINHVVIGIGINVNESMEDFLPELREIATSIALETGSKHPRSAIAAQIIHELDTLASSWPQAAEKYWKDYCEHNITLGKDISVISPNTTRYAQAMHINPDFSLHVRFENGEETDLSSGEISIRERHEKKTFL